ncbi:MAG: RNase adapter RapZ [Deltaproteobacteria bacterium CG_4_8_14_3_um_filter_51_11]|nr:RNase adapter RapZ [bacterium]OIP42294.1 MAG: RNase adaptor protein RapZ [Desulfobacteraceae bacterium CG2_30_51_40]PIP47501.1 MAG: RNase adapter RapZ [Deltaproteobacteria bacterium CG23_combo_of_CG06-09_8_20_14_all_51_20]PIX18454.1 MAG: RNase adapter RapZ [Deltaproteobacteria bacterium CG_4_8_14_3_um_filter_51_11]PIY22329.1 MAG: RNase adapter RapZ [Deltaproteobacteria bacterium CG_4_10_14_3_um_filter_51_14]
MKRVSIMIITGLSGSGKSTALKALEDIGFFCVDNMPVQLLPKFLELRSAGASEVQRLAVGMDSREREFAAMHADVFARLKEDGYRIEVLFLEASDDALISRFSQTRRHHPLSHKASLRDNIQAERELLKEVRDAADKVIDTSFLTVHQLRELIIHHGHKGATAGNMRIGIISFGFKYGVPQETDLMADVRFIPNPYFLPELKKLDGRDERVRGFVLKWEETKRFLGIYLSMLDFLIPLYEKEGKAYLTISVGCTGGRHRSVAVSEEMFGCLQKNGREISILHRDIDLA